MSHDTKAVHIVTLPFSHSDISITQDEKPHQNSSNDEAQEHKEVTIVTNFQCFVLTKAALML